jgi:DNA-binding MarR family transcriptional regulator
MGYPKMNETTAVMLTNDLFQVMRQLPRLNFREPVIEGLTASEKGLLLMLAMNAEDRKAALKATDISNLLQITPAGVTHLLNPLEQKGYIERLPDAKDRRIVRIRVTASGAKAAQSIGSEAQRQLIGLVEHLGEKDSRALIRLLSKAIEHFTAQSGT